MALGSLTLRGIFTRRSVYVSRNIFRGRSLFEIFMDTRIQSSFPFLFLCNTETYTQHWDKIQSAYMKGLEAYIKEAENLSRYYLMPGIVSVRDFFYGNSTAYIVMEYIDGIDMKQYAKLRGGRLKPEEVISLLKDVLKALQAVHEDNIIHRDISPDNIMLTRKDMHAVLIDFGRPVPMETAKMHRFC